MKNKVIGNVEEILRSNEYKLTPRRELILKALLENKGKHMSAEEVYNYVKRIAPDVGLATVYRTLELFTEFDIIHSNDFGDGRKRYEFGHEDGETHHHHHLICTNCGDIMEVNEDLLDDLEQRITSEYGFQIMDHKVKFFGLCKSCQSKKR